MPTTAVTGLPISTYFSAYKLKWLLDNVPAVAQAAAEGRAAFGTVDSWLIWQLTGGRCAAVVVRQGWAVGAAEMSVVGAA